jgi:hypothetical protein
MKNRSPFRDNKTSPEIIRLAVMMYFGFPLSLGNVTHPGWVLAFLTPGHA